MSLFLRAAVAVAACALGAVACSQSGDDPARESDGDPAREPDGEPALGGESSDFGGTPSPCVTFEQLNLIDADAATALGFDVPTLVSRVERGFDEPLRWMPASSSSGALSAPLPSPTRVQGRARILSYLYVSLDPASCDGHRCLFGGAPLECPDRLELRIEAELRTLDGIVDTTAMGYVFQGRPGFSFESPAGTVFAGLPDTESTRGLSWLEFTQLGNARENASLYFGDGRIEGDLHTGAPTPLWGHWPDVESR